MKNPSLPYLLRAMSKSETANQIGCNVIYEQAAIELEKLNKIYKLVDANKHWPVDVHTILYTKDS